MSIGNELASAFGALLADRCTPDAVRAIDGGGSADALWREIDGSGFVDALVPEAAGGAGLALRDVFALATACGAHAVPLPVVQTMLARGAIAHAGGDVPAGPLTMAALAGIVGDDERRAIGAAATAALIAGAGDRVLAMSIEHARQRVQFGKPIGSFQAVQHQLAVMAEQACVARMAAQLAFASDGPLPDRTLAAIGRGQAGDAAATLAAAAHAVHGAMGITAEFDLQLYTRRLKAWRTDGGGPTHWAREVGRDWWRAGGADAVGHVLTRLDAAAA